MWIMKYSPEEVSGLTEGLVYVRFGGFDGGTVLVKEVKIVKETEKTYKQERGTPIHKRDIGSLSYGKGYVFHKDLNKAVEEYKRLTIARAEEEIESLNKDIEEAKRLGIRWVKEGEVLY